MENINLKINGMEISVPKGTTILEAAHMANIDIPTLCFLKDINEIGACRICVVEANEGRGFRIGRFLCLPCKRRNGSSDKFS